MAEKVVNSERKRTNTNVFRYWIRRLAKIAVVLIVLLALAGVLYQAIASSRDMRQYPPPGKLVDIGGYRLHINSTGKGIPTVILDAGVCDYSLHWCLVQPEVAKFTRVCSYDRAGLGWSDTGPSPRTSKIIVRELHTLLEKAGIPGPYVLVGHSFGGYNVRLFAHEYPEEVAGLVLVDAAHENQWPKLPWSVRKLYKWWTRHMKSRRFWSLFGVNRLFYRTGVNPKLPENLQATDRAMRLRTQYFATLYNEWSEIDGQSAEQLRAANPLPQVPTMILTAEKQGDEPPPGVSEEDFAKWNTVLCEAQAEFASRYKDSVHIVIAHSTHTIPLDQPKAVIEAIRKVVMAARDQTPLRTQEQ